jgi:hypothetical protein
MHSRRRLVAGTSVRSVQVGGPPWTRPGRYRSPSSTVAASPDSANRDRPSPGWTASSFSGNERCCRRSHQSTRATRTAALRFVSRDSTGPGSRPVRRRNRSRCSASGSQRSHRLGRFEDARRSPGLPPRSPCPRSRVRPSSRQHRAAARPTAAASLTCRAAGARARAPHRPRQRTPRDVAACRAEAAPRPGSRAGTGPSG